MAYDKRIPKLEKIGCFSSSEEGGFSFFNRVQLKDNDVFVYRKGVLWRLKTRGKD